jgi:prophage antirepressor-like protein
MSALTTFENKDFQSMTVWKDELGREFFRAIDVCSNLRHSNPTQALTRHVNPKYIIQVDDGTNRAGKTNYLSEAGLYQLVFASKTEWAEKFQYWVFEDVLPKLRNQGYYIARSDDATLAAMTAEIAELRSEHLLRSIVTEFMTCNFEYIPGVHAGAKTWSGKNFVMSEDVYERWGKWIPVNYPQHKSTWVYNCVRVEIDNYLKSQPISHKKRIHISNSNGCGDLENCKMLPFTKAKCFGRSGIYKLGE